MAPQDHLVWFEDNIAWFTALPATSLSDPVPACPGWSVADVVNHLSFGLGLAYPVAALAPPDTAADRVFAHIDWPTERPTGADVMATFVELLGACLRGFHRIDPATPCWTYAGPGQAAFWFRRAAIETALHRLDIEEALGRPYLLGDERAEDAILDAVTFALPYAAGLTAPPPGRLVVSSSCLAHEVSAGSNGPIGYVHGDPTDVVNALWGRNPERVSLTGDRDVASGWLGLVEQAFAGR